MLIEKITKRINCWTSKTLSYAVRLQLIHSVLFLLHTYWTSLFILPKEVIKSIEGICRNFLWNQKPDYVKAPPVVWDFVCKPKRTGGLGIIKCEVWNHVVAKHLWSIASGKICLWVRWIHGLYIKNQSIWSVTIKEDSAWYWTKFLKIWERMISGYSQYKWQVSASGEYTKASGYRWLMEPMTTDLMAAITWSRFNNPKHAFCFWWAALKKIATKERLIRLGMALEGLTSELICHQDESHEHLFFKCSLSQCVLQNALCQFGFTNNIYRISDSLTAHVASKLKKPHKQVQYLCITAVAYSTWTERNSSLHTKSQHAPQQMTEQCIYLIKQRLLFLRRICKKKRTQDYLKQIVS